MPSILSSISLNKDQDQPLWTLSPIGQFTVGLFYKRLTKREFDEIFSFKRIKRLIAPPRIAFFVWEVAHGSILTIDKFMRCGKTMVN